MDPSHESQGSTSDPSRDGTCHQFVAWPSCGSLWRVRHSGDPSRVFRHASSSGRQAGIDRILGTWLLSGRDQVQSPCTGRVLPSDARVVFLDADLCAVLGSGENLPRAARVGLDFVDPGYAVTGIHRPGGDVLVPAPTSTLCGT